MELSASWRWVGTLSLCIAPIAIMVLQKLRRPAYPSAPHMTAARKMLPFQTLLISIPVVVWSLLERSKVYLKLRVTMDELRASAGLPLEDDTLPDRDAFEACQGAYLEYTNDGGCASYRVHRLGKALTRKRTINTLYQRKQLIELKASPPDNVKPRRLPRLIVVGLPRTGTTILSRLLFTLPETWGPTLRQMMDFPDIPIGFKQKMTTWSFKTIEVLAPLIKAIHPMSLDDHEEDQFLMKISGWFPQKGISRWEGYLENRTGWKKHVAIIYQQLRENLDLLATQHAPDDATHMICKFPLYGLYPEEVCQQANHPDHPVVLIRTYRKSLTKAAESLISLFMAGHDIAHHEYCKAAIEGELCATIEAVIDGYEKMDFLSSQEPSRIKVVDVAFEDLCKRPVETVLKLREVMGLPAYDDIHRGEVVKQLSEKTEVVGSHRTSKYAKFHGYTLSEASATWMKKLEKKQDALMHPIVISE